MLNITNYQGIQIKKNTVRYHLTPVIMEALKKTKVTKSGKDNEKEELSYTAGTNVM